MKRLSTSDMKDLLAQRVAGQPPDAQVFWSDFKARARLMNQESAAEKPSFAISVRTWAVATACIALLALFSSWFLLQRTSEREEAGEMTLDVVAAHSAVFMIEDEQSHGTIVWIDGMQAEHSGDHS